MPDLFCRMVSGEVPCARVLNDEHVLGFLDHRPVFKGHVLLVPKVHVATVDDLPAELMVPLLSAGQRVAAAQRAELGCTGTFMAMNNVVSQSIPHLHLHVVPRVKGDGLRGFFWPRTKYAEGEMALYAERLRAVLSTDPGRAEPPVAEPSVAEPGQTNL